MVYHYRDIQSLRVSYHLIKTYFCYSWEKNQTPTLYVKNSKIRMFCEKNINNTILYVFQHAQTDFLGLFFGFQFSQWTS